MRKYRDPNRTPISLLSYTRYHWTALSTLWLTLFILCVVEQYDNRLMRHVLAPLMQYLLLGYYCFLVIQMPNWVSDPVQFGLWTLVLVGLTMFLRSIFLIGIAASTGLPLM